jgi:threonine/homoserine/homoserine lactone efflux protein
VLTQAIGDLLPSAVGVAISPVPVVAVILMLATPRGRSNGPAFAVGWVAGLVVVSAIVQLAADGASDPDSSTSTGVEWFKVVLGVLFLGMAVRQWRSRPRGDAEPELPRWMANVDAFTPVRSLVLGAVLSGVNPKNLALTAAAAASIAQAGLSGGDAVVATAVFVVIASLTVVGPVVYQRVAGATAAGPLATLKQFLAEHNAAIMMAVLLVLGVKLLGEGFGGVTN